MSTLRVNEISARTGTGDIAIPSGNRIVCVDGGSVVAPGMVVQTVINRNTTALSTSSATLATLFSQSVTTKLPNSTLLVYAYVSQRVDNGNGTWNLGYIQVLESTTSTQVMYSGYNGVFTNFIHDYTAEKPFYAGAAGTTYTFQLRVGSYTGTVHFNSPANDSSDGYAILRILEIAQ